MPNSPHSQNIQNPYLQPQTQTQTQTQTQALREGGLPTQTQALTQAQAQAQTLSHIPDPLLPQYLIQHPTYSYGYPQHPQQYPLAYSSSPVSYPTLDVIDNQTLIMQSPSPPTTIPVMENNMNNAYQNNIIRRIAIGTTNVC